MNGQSVQRAYVKTRGQQRVRRGVPRAPARARLAAARGSLALSRRYLATAANKESGYVDLAVATRNLDTTGSITLVATIAQGAGVQQRVGKKVQYLSCQLRGFVASGSACVVALGTIMLVYDKRPTGALPAITEVLVTIDSRSMNNDDNSGRFRILRRWDFSFSGNTTTPATGTEMQQVMEYVDLKKLPAVYKAVGTGAIGDIEQGALYLITVGDRAAGTGAASSSVGIRTRFIDV